MTLKRDTQLSALRAQAGTVCLDKRESAPGRVDHTSKACFGFQRIHQYGLLANRCRERRLNQCRDLLAVAAPMVPLIETSTIHYITTEVELVVRH